MNSEIWFPNLGIEIKHLDRVAFNFLGKLPVYWYGIIMVSSILIAILYVSREAKKTGQNPDSYYDLAIFGIIGAIIGARAYYVAFSWDSYKNNLIKIFALREGGLALYGSLLGGILAAFIYTKVKKHNFLLFTDTIAPAFILAQAIGRWGNFLNREAFGGYTESLFAMRLLTSTVSYIPAQVMEKIIIINGASYIQVHPTFLYESVWNFTGFLILLYFKDKKKFEGQITAIYFLIYGLGRIWIEGLRTDQLQIGSTGIAISQVLSGIFIAAAVMFLIFGKNRKAKADADNVVSFENSDAEQKSIVENSDN